LTVEINHSTIADAHPPWTHDDGYPSPTHHPSPQADQTPEIVEQKTELTVGLSQFVQWDDIASDNEPEAQPVQSLEAPINLSATSSASGM